MSKEPKTPATIGTSNVKKSSKVHSENKGLNALNFQELSSIIDEIKQEEDLKKHYKIQKLMMVFNRPIQEFRNSPNIEFQATKKETKRKKPDFRTKLQFHHANLTQAEILLCELIILEKSCNEIAEILELSPGTVRVYKNKLKSKLNLTSENNLGEYLINLDDQK
jgi:DNA-binding CsgD family transcriptional regulator